MEKMKQNVKAISGKAYKCTKKIRFIYFNTAILIIVCESQSIKEKEQMQFKLYYFSRISAMKTGWDVLSCHLSIIMPMSYGLFSFMQNIISYFFVSFCAEICS